MIALATTSIAWILFAVLAIGWIVYALTNIASSRKEAGAEMELAPNRKPYYDDGVLEGRRLEMVQLLGVLLLIVVVVGLPLYWIFEPSRQAGAREGADSRLVGWGEDLFAPTAEGGFNCAGCHGGMKAGGADAPYSLTDQRTGEVRAVTWKAPALNTIFYKYTEDEVRFIIEYGRPYSPMSAWGLDGGGPLNEQQIDSLLAYLKSIQIERVGCAEGEGDPKLCESGQLPEDVQADIESAARASVNDGTYESYGEALFNLELNSGAYSCARCHTEGWSYDDPGVAGQGALGWNLTGGSVNAHFPNQEDMVEFVSTGSEYGAVYGMQGQGTGRMPAFGAMLTDAQIEAIVEYVRGL